MILKPALISFILIINSCYVNSYAQSASSSRNELSGREGVKFTFKTNGPIRGTPCIYNNAIFFGSGDGKMYAIDTLTGKKYWEFITGDAIFSSPVAAKGIVYFASRDRYIYALQSATGKLVWKFKFGEDLSAQNFWDYYLGSPVVDKNVVYIGAGDGFLYAFEAKNGKVKWKYNAGSRIRRALAVSDSKIIFGTMTGEVIELDKQGKYIWTFSTDGVSIPFEKNGLDNTSIFTIPAIGDGYVAIAGRDFVLYLLDLKTGKEVWRYNHPNSWVLSTAIYDGKVIAGSGVAAFVHANDLKTGKLLWQFKTKSPVYSSFTFANGLMYFGDMLTGNIYGLDPRTGQQKWLFPMGYMSFSTPVVSGNTVFCSSEEGTLYAVRGISADDTTFIHSRRIVYYEGNLTDSAFHYFNLGVDVWVRDYLKRQGYELMNADQLKIFMSSKLDGASHTVVVFADNKIPKAVVNEESENTLIRKYLDAGGKVVFLTTVNPLFITTDPKTGALLGNTNIELASKIFGIKFSTQDFGNGFYYSPYTEQGKKWGLVGYTEGYWPVDPIQVTTVLARDEYGKAVCWVKNYGGPQGSGLMTLSFIPTNVLGSDFFPMRAAIEYGINW
jgi:outer membrane protein assembly factor BamB